jgi:hypothetical protein
MNTAKKLIYSGLFIALPYDAGPLLRIITTESQLSMSSKHKSLITDTKNKVNFEYSKDIFPFFRLYSDDDKLLGYAHLFENGVGRVMLFSENRTKYHELFKQLFSPCLCKAGHLLVIRFRISENQLKCCCNFSLLKSLEDSFDSLQHCPISKESEIPFRIYQNHAIATIDQRARISYPR